MRHTGLRIIAITMVAAAALAFSGTGWAQQKGKADSSAKQPAASSTAATAGSSGTVKAESCISVRDSKDTCIRARDGGNPLTVKASK